MSTATALIVSTAIAAASQGVQTWQTAEDASKARHAQTKSQVRAEELQKEADTKAEQQRLEGLATNQAATDYANIWGTNGNKYADAAQKLSAGTGSFGEDEEETNPFYTRGLI